MTNVNPGKRESLSNHFYSIWPAGGGVLKESMQRNTISSWPELAWQVGVYSRSENGEKRGDSRGH